ncbi:MAG: sugar phosphate isomerase/epimerase [Clostridiales bacterium]|nr:sugar phosphate isomerase/epimerase [Clostridiales bacterium]
MSITIENFTLRQKFGEEQALKIIKDAGFDGVDYSFNDDGKGKSIDLSNHIEKAREVKSYLDKYGLVCKQSHAPFSFSLCDELSLENKNFSDLIKSFEFASIIGCKIVVVHSICLPPEIDFFEYNYNYYKALEPYAKKYGIKIAVENLVNSIFWRPNRLSHFIRQLDSSVFCACIDVGHSMLMGMPPEEYILGMDKDLIGCIHIHDTDAKVDRHWMPFHGEQNWDNIMKSLADYGFNADINLEVIRPLNTMPEGLMFPFVKYAVEVGRYLEKTFESYKNK